MAGYEKPLPAITEANRPFWEAARKGELRMQRCTACGHIRYPINPVCTACLGSGTEWIRLSGRGTVFASLVYYQVYHPAFKDDSPYNVSLIQLEEGPRMFSNVIGIPPDEVKVGDAVEVVFDRVTEEVTIPRFRLFTL
ncbi:MAG: Zn-ribbon domain-containing OB-fold protein [Chloroflexota bacterium]|nr:Zn-ribbon domain-containing OB-fold protein [Chloroflexota bacterium]